MKRYIAAAILCLGHAEAGQAQDWKQYATNAAGLVDFFYDRASVQRSGDRVEVNTREDHSMDTSADYAEARWSFSVDCARRTYTILSYAFYGVDGKVIRFRNQRGESGPRPVGPNSIAEDLFNAVCRR